MRAKSRTVKLLVRVANLGARPRGSLGARALLRFPPLIRGCRVVRLAQWARLLTPGRQGLRAGAWYTVVSRTPKEVQLTVRGRTVTIARSLVELRDTPPSEWTVVHPANARESYLVCPACRHRAPLPDRHVANLRCPRCNVAFAITWGGTRAPSPPAELRADRRVGRRRQGRERRSGPERRGVARGAAVARRHAERRALLERRRKPAGR